MKIFLRGTFCGMENRKWHRKNAERKMKVIPFAYLCATVRIFTPFSSKILTATVRPDASVII
jgi:hypothetical protein